MNENPNSNGFGPARWLSMLRKHRNGAEAAEWRRLALRLHHDLPREAGPRSAMLVTPTRAEFSALAAAQLAIHLADQLRRTVILVDASPSQPELTRLLGWSAAQSNAIAAASAARFEDLVLPTSRENLLFVPDNVSAGWAKTHPDEGARPFLRRAEQESDFVLLFGGSVSEEPLVRPLASEVGCVLLLATENSTRTDDLDDAKETLLACRARRIALLLTTDVYDPAAGSFLPSLIGKVAARPEHP